MNRSVILNNIKKSFYDYSSKSTRQTIEKVLNYAGSTFNIRERSDIKTEAVMFKYNNGSTDYLVDDEKPVELIQSLSALVYIEQADQHSTKEVRYNRMLEISDVLIEWADSLDAHSEIGADVESFTFSGVSSAQEDDGYLLTELNFKTTINIR
jgi:hypothetical protein